MEKEVADQIYDAIIGKPEEIVEPIPAVLEQKRFIKACLNCLNIQNKKDIAMIVVNNEYKSLFKESSEGLVLDIDKLPEYVITEMYVKIKEKY